MQHNLVKVNCIRLNVNLPLLRTKIFNDEEANMLLTQKH